MTNPDNDTELRQQAEARLRETMAQTPESLAAPTPEAVQQLLHDLRVQQIELEMQNEELRASQLALEVTRARYFELYDLAPVGYCTISAQGLILQANLTAASMLGMDRGMLVKQPFSRLIFKEDQDIYYLHRKRLAESGDTLSCELRMVRQDGTPFWAQLAITTAHDADGAPELRAVLGDITARKQAEDALVKVEVLHSAILDSANFSIIATDTTGVIQFFNVGAERMLGYAATEVVNKITPADISDPQEVIAHAQALSIELGTEIAPGFEALMFKASRGIEDIYELAYQRKDGSHFPAVVSITALRDARNAITGYLLIGTDNTARKRVEAERIRLDQALHEKNAELESARVLADKANRAKSDFLSSMSHELRTPLNAILGFAQLMAAGSPPPTSSQQGSLDQILKGGWYLLELINEILDLALIESGKVTLSREPVSLAEVMFECQAMIEPLAQQRGIGLSFPRFEIPCFVNADRTRLKQVLINLLSNAIKYNQPNGTVDVACIPSFPNSIRISIRDAGAGLTQEQLAQLFQSFNRLGKEDGPEEGTGIGLVVAKRLVELMGGTIGADSAVGVGCVFWIKLILTGAPQLVDTQETGHAAALPPPAPDVTSLSTPLRTLLYVEDNPANLELVEQLVARRADLRLLTAADGYLGIDLARTHQPEVILMDIKLPGLSGIETMKILRADPATAHIPIIAISANAVHRDVKQGIEEGFFDYLTKPIRVNQFMETLDLALASRAAKSGA